MPNQDHSQGSTRRGPLRLSVRLIVVLLAAVPLVGLTAGALWADHSWRDAEETRRAAVAGSLARFLRDSAQTVLASRDPGPLRLLLSSLGAEYGVEEASVTLGNGVVIAHSTPALASRDPLPAEWEADRSKRVEPGTTVSEGRVTSTVEFNVEGGTGWVTVTMPTSTPMIAAGTLEGLGLIGLGCVALTLLLARVATGFLRPLQAIQSAMRELSAGEESPAVLAVCAGWGPEAEAFNRLLAERQSLRDRLLDRQADGHADAARPADGPLEKACDALPHGLLLIDGSLKVRFGNGAASVLLGAPRGELPGRKLGELVPDEQVTRLARAVIDGLRRRGTAELDRALGDERTVLRVTVSRASTDGTPLAVVLLEDMTQQRVADKARDAFVSSATHELRTPLTNIRLYVESLLEEAEPDEQTRKTAINVINQESRRLERLVSDMLSVAEIEAGSMKLHTGDVRLGPMFEELQSDYQAQCQEKQITLAWDLPPKWPIATGDRDKLAMALHNLIGNALKYTPAGGSVTVSVEVGSSAVLIRVRDSGIGVAPDEHERIFEKFYRSKDARVAKVTGTGLGLSLARDVARLHGGDITLESQLDRGSTFTMSLPLGAVAQAA